MDWRLAEKLLIYMAEVYTQNNFREITFNTEIFPLLLRYGNGERSKDP
jgi:hypothetical protein